MFHVVPYAWLRFAQGVVIWLRLAQAVVIWLRFAQGVVIWLRFAQGVVIWLRFAQGVVIWLCGHRLSPPCSNKREIRTPSFFQRHCGPWHPPREQAIRFDAPSPPRHAR